MHTGNSIKADCGIGLELLNENIFLVTVQFYVTQALLAKEQTLITSVSICKYSTEISRGTIVLYFVEKKKFSYNCLTYSEHSPKSS
jgi:hypothetical protein